MSSNPDVLLNSFEMLHKMLLLQTIEDRNDFISQTIFPIDRVLCELQCEFLEIRRACLRVLHTLTATEFSLDHPLQRKARAVLLVEKLTKVYCESQSNAELGLVLEVMSAAMDHEEMAALFFEMNLFEKYLSRLNSGSFEPELKCKSLMVLAECAKYMKFLQRLVNSNLTESLLQCLLTSASPAAYLLQGLNRLTESSDACNRILEAYDLGLLSKLLRLLPDFEIDIKSREQASMLLQNLLSFSFHPTANAVLELNLPAILSEIFGQLPEQRSIDLLLSGLDVIETLSGNADYRERLCESTSLIENLAVVLMNSFSTAILVIRLLRCLCCLLDLQCVCLCLLNNYLCPSLKRALQSSSKQVKTAATNFIMQSTRFQVFIKEYVDSGVLETLIFNQKHALFVPTWAAAIDSILSKAPTWKFCIRNHLNFTDITFCGDFFVSTKKFDDFRILVTILREEVSPLHPVLLMNFNRCMPPEEMIRKVPCMNEKEKEWCYCRLPGDKFLPTYLEEVNNMLDSLGLAMNPPKINRSIDFENLAARAKVIAAVVDKALGNNLKRLDLNTKEECSQQAVTCHLKDLSKEMHCSIIPLGRIKMGCQFERAVLFKGLADQVGLPCTLQRSVDGNMLFNEVPLPIELDQDEHCEKRTMEFMPWRMLRPTHVVDLMYNVGELYPLQSRQALQYLRLY
ncbi:hypothetical protein DOY81_012603 [Sarcophaga bullata]|nr:hypothetical protein DOY81_012603 [Sarcophaga bullata]